MENKNSKYTLGLDVGANSIGWAVIQTDENENPIALLGTGGRIFDAGAEGDIERVGKNPVPNLDEKLAQQDGG